MLINSHSSVQLAIMNTNQQQQQDLAAEITTTAAINDSNLRSSNQNIQQSSLSLSLNLLLQVQEIGLRNIRLYILL
jgi:hypothetical protein